MTDEKLEIRLSFVPGLKDVVLNEIASHPEIVINEKSKDSVYIDFVEDFSVLKKLRSIARVYVVIRDPKYNPLYVSNHKSVLGDLINIVLYKNEARDFKTFKITCAGSDSPEVKEIEDYVESEFRLSKGEDVDMKIHIVKINDSWEIGIQTTPRPLSFREYKVRNMSGAMDPTIAYAMNSLCDLEKAKSYLNVFSGSGTLLIEAGQCYPNLEEMIGFDNDKEHLSLSIQNIKKAGLIKRIQIKEGDVFESPDFGKFDVIVSDLPFGMVISKNEDLSKLYKTFIEYSEKHLNPGGRLAVYTSEFKIFEEMVAGTGFDILQTIDIKLITSEEQYLPTKVLLLGLK